MVVFYFSGHGQLIPDPKSWGGRRSSLVTADYQKPDARVGAHTNLRSDTLRDLLRELKARMRKDPKDPNSEVEGNITVLLDSCHSGGGTKGLARAKGRAWDTAIDGPIPQPETGAGIHPKGAAGFFDKNEAVAQGYVLISACRSEQQAMAPVDGTEVSRMTYHLADLLAHAQPRATYRDIFERLSVALSAYPEDQSPQLEGRRDQRLFAAEGRPAENYLPVQEVDGNRVTLPVGDLQGATKGSRFALYRRETSVKDPKNQIAEVAIEAVRTTTSVAAPTPKYAAVDPKDLVAARAVEVLHDYGEHRLRVVFGEGQSPDTFVRVDPPAGLLRGEGDVLTTDGATPDAFDVRPAALSSTRSKTTPARGMPATGCSSGRAHRRRWRWRNLACRREQGRPGRPDCSGLNQGRPGCNRAYSRGPRGRMALSVPGADAQEGRRSGDAGHRGEARTVAGQAERAG